jgi:GNAT superfamily N-acetyltransferase
LSAEASVQPIVISLLIRSYDPGDAAACARVFDRAWNFGHPYAPRAIDVAIFEAETRGERVIVGCEGEHLLGFVSFHEPGRFVHHLYVDPDAQGRGIGGALLARAVALAGGRASLKCQTRNAGALAFYRRLGWTAGETGESSIGPWVRLLSPEPAAAEAR